MEKHHFLLEHRIEVVRLEIRVFVDNRAYYVLKINNVTCKCHKSLRQINLSLYTQPDQPLLEHRVVDL